jgi:hypothetical protein
VRAAFTRVRGLRPKCGDFAGSAKASQEVQGLRRKCEELR